MKPISLKLKGIKNYQTEQFVDFESLTSEGVFGICGKTGSGKSAIVESIIIALFGDLPSGKGYNYGIVNLTQKQAYIEFVFGLNKDGQNKKYLIERKLKAQKDNKMDAEIFDITSQKISLASGAREVKNYIIDLLKLNEKDFTQCVILEQGQYDKFVNADASERKKMIGNIFSLNKYGEQLNAKVLEYRQTYKNKVDWLESTLQNLGTIDETVIENKSKEYEDNQKQLDKIKKQKEQADKDLKNLEKLYQEYQDYLSYQKKIKTAQDQKAKLKQELDDLKKDYDQKAEQAKQIKVLSQQKEQLKSYIDSLTENQKNQEKIQSLSSDKNKKLEEYKDTNSEIIKIKHSLQQAKTNLEKYNQQITAYLAELNTLTQIKLDDDEKLAINLVDSFNEYDQKVQRYIQLIQDIDDQTQQKNQSQQELKGLFVTQAEILKTANEHKKTLEQLEQEYSHITIHNAKALLQSQAKIGDNCPVCNNIIQELPQNLITVNIDDLTKKIDFWKKAYYDINQAQASQAEKISNLEKSIKEKQDIIQKLQDELAKLKLDNTCIKKKEQFEKIKQDCLSLIILREKAQKDIQTQNTELEKKEVLLEHIKKDGQSLAQQIQELQDQLKKVLGEYDSFDQALQQSNQKYNQLDAQIKKLDEDERAAQTAINDVNNNFIKVMTELESFKKHIAKLSSKEIKQEQIDQLRQQKDDLDKKQTQISQKLGEQKSEIKRLEQDLIKINQTKKDLAQAQQKFDLIVQLHKLTTSNKLMEFMAEEYIEEFTYTASEYLNLLTMGQFDLVYENGFWIKDHFCGGQLRKVNTVSGGEMFLVSLSLAISISRALSRRSGAAAVEFLFIDEGFGTLDSDLIDTVMDALEKLKDSFVIGLISHRMELQQRLPKKLYIERTSKGSVISY